MAQGLRGHSNVKLTRWGKNGSTTFPWQQGTVILVKALEKLLHESYAAMTAVSSIINEPVRAHIIRMIFCEDKSYFYIAECILVRLDAVMGGHKEQLGNKSLLLHCIKRLHAWAVESVN